MSACLYREDKLEEEEEEIWKGLTNQETSFRCLLIKYLLCVRVKILRWQLDIFDYRFPSRVQS